MSGFSHNCRHGRYVRLDRTLSLSLSLSFLQQQPTLNGSGILGAANSRSFVAINVTTSASSRSKTSASSSSSSSSSSASATAALAASSSLSPLLWALLPAQFGVDPSPASSPGQTTATATASEAAARRQQPRVQHVRLPAGTVLQLRDLQVLLALASAPDPSLPGGVASTPAGSGTGIGIGTGYSVLRYPCSATDFQDYYFGKPSNNNNRPSAQAPLSGAIINNVSSVVSVVSAFAAEEVIARPPTHSLPILPISSQSCAKHTLTPPTYLITNRSQ